MIRFLIEQMNKTKVTTECFPD